MKIRNKFWFAVLVIISGACALEKEPLIPSGIGNEKVPEFFPVIGITALSGESVLAKTKIQDLGNLSINRHGWVWDINANPTLDKNKGKLEFGNLEIDSFQTVITGLEIGNKYYFRPFIAYGSELKYGPDSSLSMNLPSIEKISINNDSTCVADLKYVINSKFLVVENGVIIAEGEKDPLFSENLKLKSSSLSSIQIPNLKPSTAYSIRIYATNSTGIVYSDVQKLITRTRPNINLDFSLNTDTILFQGALVQVSNNSNGIVDYQWNLGDGNTSKALNPLHEFNRIGNFLLTLEGKKEGCIFKKQTTITVLPNPFEDYWVKLSGGEFSMGCTSEQVDCDPDESPVHQVTLSPFEIGKTEITQKQWQTIMNYNAAFNKACGPDCPVELVAMPNILKDFIPILNRRTGRVHRLPTEAEWEYAARGGQDFRFSGGSDLNEVGWNLENSANRTHAVALKKANGYGLYDMSGNVWEWCFDYYDKIYYSNSPLYNPTGAIPPTPTNFRLIRGGGFQEGTKGARVSYRQSWSPVQPTHAVGFRLVRVLN